MTFFSNLSPDWYKYTNGHRTQQHRYSDTFLMPNTTSPYPPTYPNRNIVSSSCTDPRDADIYSGVEPLESINASATQLTALFSGTTVPGTASVIYNPQRSERKQFNRYQKPTPMGVEYYGTLEPNLYGVDRHRYYEKDPWNLPMRVYKYNRCC